METESKRQKATAPTPLSQERHATTPPLVPEVIGIILSYLPASDAARCSLVSLSWAAAFRALPVLYWARTLLAIVKENTDEKNLHFEAAQDDASVNEDNDEPYLNGMHRSFGIPHPQGDKILASLKNLVAARRAGVNLRALCKLHTLAAKLTGLVSPYFDSNILQYTFDLTTTHIVPAVFLNPLAHPALVDFVNANAKANADEDDDEKSTKESSEPSNDSDNERLEKTGEGDADGSGGSGGDDDDDDGEAVKKKQVMTVLRPHFGGLKVRCDLHAESMFFDSLAQMGRGWTLAKTGKLEEGQNRTWNWFPDEEFLEIFQEKDMDTRAQLFWRKHGTMYQDPPLVEGISPSSVIELEGYMQRAKEASERFVATAANAFPGSPIAKAEFDVGSCRGFILGVATKEGDVVGLMGYAQHR
jgi:hypothetical protein